AVVLFAAIKTWSTLRSGSEDHLKSQLLSLTAVFGSLLLSTRIRDPSLTFRLACVGIVLGVSAPWVEQILPASSFFQNLLSTQHLWAPAMFGAGVAFISKSAGRIPHTTPPNTSDASHNR